MSSIDDLIFKTKIKLKRRITDEELKKLDELGRKETSRAKSKLSAEQQRDVKYMAGKLKQHIQEYERQKAPDSMRTMDEYLDKQAEALSRDAGIGKSMSKAIIRSVFRSEFGIGPNEYAMNQWTENLFKRPGRTQSTSNDEQQTSRPKTRSNRRRRRRDNDRDRGR